MSCDPMMTTPPATQITAPTMDAIKLMRRRCLRNARKRFHVSCDSDSARPDAVAPDAVVELSRERREGLYGTKRIRGDGRADLEFFRSEHCCDGLLVDCFAVVENDAAAHFGASLIDGAVQSLAAVRSGAARQSMVVVVDAEKDGVGAA